MIDAGNAEINARHNATKDADIARYTTQLQSFKALADLPATKIDGKQMIDFGLGVLGVRPEHC